ncbi:hypothetical protein ACFCYN_24620 [Gottfriedia sp. NPDC056225]
MVIGSGMDWNTIIAISPIIFIFVGITFVLIWLMTLLGKSE